MMYHGNKAGRLFLSAALCAIGFLSHAAVAAANEGGDKSAKTSDEKGAKDDTAQQLDLEGIRFSAPAHWEREKIEPGPFAAIAAYALKGDDGKATECTLRITHYPKMKGMDDPNIARWVASVQKPDGSPYTRDEANERKIERDGVRITIVDLTGTVQSGMGQQDAGDKDHRLIAAIVDHAKGPHFLKFVGPAKQMEKFAEGIDRFMNSAKVIE